VFGLWPVGLADDLRHALVEEGIRKVDLWTARHKLVAVEFAADPHDPFFNVNRPEDVEQAERIAAEFAA
jgi:molybdopterin-guanine dinucleotide biosynthesis protein A